MPDTIEIKQLVFGPVVIQWHPPWKFPIAIDHNRPGMFVTQCPVTYRYGEGDYAIKIPADFTFDGASIPWIFRVVPGFAKLDWHLLASLPHDYFIENPKHMPRSVADGIFVSVLIALAEHRKDSSKKLTKIQGHLMYMAVWSWTVWSHIRNPPNNASGGPPKADSIDVAPPDEPSVPEKAAVTEAQEETKEETAEPPPQVPALEGEVKNVVEVEVENDSDKFNRPPEREPSKLVKRQRTKP